MTTAQRKRINYFLRSDQQFPKPRRTNSDGPESELTARRQLPTVRIRPKSSKKRSVETILKSGVYDRERYIPTKLGRDREKEKEKLQNRMAYGDQKPPKNDKIRPKNQELEEDLQENRFDQLVQEIKEREEFLDEMSALGFRKKYEAQIQEEINSRIREMEKLSLRRPYFLIKYSDGQWRSTMKSNLDVYFVLVIVIIISAVTPCRIKFWNPFQGNKHVAALILARSGSKGIPLKNLAPFGNTSLLLNSLGVITHVPFDSIWISVDNHRIFAEVSRWNVHWRSPESATDTAPSILGVQNFISQHPEVDIVALIQCTSPNIKVEYLRRGLDEIRSGKECVFTVKRSYQLRWEINEGAIKPINFNISRRPRRQDWKGEFVENGMFYFASRELINLGKLQSFRCSIVEIPQWDSLEIDTQYDLDVANKLLELS